MKAVRVLKPFEIALEDIPEPQIQSDTDVKIRITSCGICGSDIGIYTGTNSLATYPRLIGHEFGGIVTETGAGVTGIVPGDKVAVDPVVSCGHCYACRIHRHNVCSNLEVMGVHRDGGFCEYVCVPEKNVYKFHTDFDERYLGVVEPFTIGMEVSRRAQIAEGDKVLVMGSGPIGISAMQVARCRHAQVMITDLLESRLLRARAMGADRTVNVSAQDLQKEIDDFTDGEGIPVIVDTVCTPSSFEQSVQMACPAGRVVVLGLRNAPSGIAMADITKKELTIVGSRLNNHCFGEVIQYLEEGRLHTEEYVTNLFPLGQIEEALRLIREQPQEVLKVVLIP